MRSKSLADVILEYVEDGEATPEELKIVGRIMEMLAGEEDMD